MPRPPRAELPRELLEAATSEFAEHGYHPVTLTSIARRCGATKGAVYLHFRSKLAVFLAAHRALETLHDRAISTAGTSAEPASPLEAVRRTLLTRLEFHQAHAELRSLQRILDTELATEPAATGRDGLRASYRELRATLRGHLQRAIRAGELGPLDPAAGAFWLTALFEGTLAQSRAAEDDVAHFITAPTLVESWLAALPKAPKRRSSVPSTPAPEGDGADFRPAF